MRCVLTPTLWLPLRTRRSSCGPRVGHVAGAAVVANAVRDDTDVVAAATYTAEQTRHAPWSALLVPLSLTMRCVSTPTLWPPLRARRRRRGTCVGHVFGAAVVASDVPVDADVVVDDVVRVDADVVVHIAVRVDANVVVDNVVRVDTDVVAAATHTAKQTRHASGRALLAQQSLPMTCWSMPTWSLTVRCCRYRRCGRCHAHGEADAACSVERVLGTLLAPTAPLPRTSPPPSPPPAPQAPLWRTVAFVLRAPRQAPAPRETGRGRQGCGKGSRAKALRPSVDERRTAAMNGVHRGPRSVGRRLPRRPVTARGGKRLQPAPLPLRPPRATEASTTTHAASCRARRRAPTSRGWGRAASLGTAPSETFVSRRQPRPADAGRTSSSARSGRRSTALSLGHGAR